MSAFVSSDRNQLLTGLRVLLAGKNLRGCVSRLAAWFLCMVWVNGYCAGAMAFQGNQDTVLHINFGTENKIVYHFGSGKYDALFVGGSEIKQAAAIVGSVDTLGAVNPIYESSRMNYVRFGKKQFKSPLGPAVVYTIYRNNEQGVVMEQDFTVFKHKDYFLAKVRILNSDTSINYSSPLSAAKVNLSWKGDNYALRSPFDNDMWATYETKRLDSVHMKSSEVTTIFNENKAGLVIGSLEHKVWKTGIDLQSTSPHSFRLAAFGGYTDQQVTHDLRAHGWVRPTDGALSSPEIMIGLFSDWRTGMEIYGTNNRLTEPPFIGSWKGSTPVCWNSWGVLQSKIDLASAKGVVDFFADSCKVYRTKDKKLFIDLDSFWDRMIRNGLDGNVDDLKAFVDYCKTAGFEPGIYWAPFTDWGKQADRQVEGSDYLYQKAWTSINGKPLDVDGGRAMDPTHPATRQRMVKFIGFFKSLGFKMIKIDFLGHATLDADYYYDPEVTTGMEAFRSGMEFLDSLLDNKMLVYAAISPNLATGRYVHMRRIACDAFKSISETTYTLNSVTYGWWQSHLYDYMDADHVVFKDATIGENRARLVSAVVTGSLITGDDYSKQGPWRETAKILLQNKAIIDLVGMDGKSFRPHSIIAGKDPARVFEKRVGEKLYLAVFNYDNKSTEWTIPYKELGIVSPKNLKVILGAPQAKFSLQGQQLMINLPKTDAAILCLEH